ncbi:putative serine/threonine-protein kinase iks1 [Mortierella sp. NVP41]|nr:putative serine/threonine-protein kinase iks1 [Mortierella sp. NVP41]
MNQLMDGCIHCKQNTNSSHGSFLIPTCPLHGTTTTAPVKVMPATTTTTTTTFTILTRTIQDKPHPSPDTCCGSRTIRGRQHYRESVSDKGHESDPSELMRPPVLLGSSPPTYHGLNAAMRSGEGGDRTGREMFPPVRRSNRSMSLSMGPHIWHDERPTMNGPSLSSPGMPFSARSHREIVPYSQEWRVILRSPPRGRTVLYNPQMQSLVVQTTVGPDSHPMSLRNDSRICALCRRPLDLDDSEDQSGAANTSGFMDSNYFRMLADANIALSRRGSLQANTEPEYPEPSPIGSPTSSSRASLDIDHQSPPLGENRNRTRDPNNPAHLSHDALNQGYYERFFVEQMKLGRGYRGSVFLCQHILDGIHLGEYAIKKVAVGDNHDWLVQMLREVHLLERLHHPNIVAYKHAWLENHQLHKFGPEVTCLFILMECANGGNLEEYIERPAETQPRTDAGIPAEEGSGQGAEAKKPMSARERLQSKRQHLQSMLNSPPVKAGESSGAAEGLTTQQRHSLSITEIWSFFFDICEGLAHLHRLGIIHRDLKPPNLLLSYSNSQVKGSKGERPRILITDFGECEISDQAAKRDRTGATGTLEFLAPELLAVDVNGRYTDEFSFKGDMWSLGMVLYYLCYSRLPYTQIDDVDILKEEIREFKSITLPPDEPGDRLIPEELKILIRVLLSTDKSKRPSCDDILSTLSHQRDRMMHGNMDSPTVTIRASSSTFSSQSTQSQEEVDGRRKEDGIRGGNGSRDDSMESQQSISKGPHPLTSYRQHYFSPTFGTSRRRSRATLVVDGLRTGSGQPSTSPSTATRNTASPSLNLHKKVKPLGLGLRHMLRRRMMHPAAISGAGMYKYSRSEQGYPWLDVALKPRVPKSGFAASSSSSMAVDRSPVLEMMMGEPQDSVVGQRQTDLYQQQQFQSRKRAASGKGSNLGLAVELNPEGQDIVEGGSEPSGSGGLEERPTEVSGGPRRSLRQASARRMSHEPVPGSSRNSVSSNSKQKRPRDTKDRQPPRREALASESEESSSDNPLLSAHRRRLSGQQEGGRTGAITKAHPPLGKTYWTNLASTHAREMSRSDSGGIGDFAAGAGREVQANLGSASSGSATDEEDDVGEESDHAGTDQQPLRRGGGRRRRHRTASRQSTTLNKHDQQAVQLQHHSKPPLPTPGSLSSSSSSAGLPEHFSAHFMFVSLVVRIWACLSICNPIMVRPMVLYPVLVITVVWDRYVLSLVSEHFRKSASSSQQQRRRVKGGAEEIGSTDNDAANSRTTDGQGEDSLVVAPADGTVDDVDAGRQSSVVLKARNPSHDVQDDDNGHDEVDVEDSRSMKLIWQALLSGVVLQALWICLVWLFSRGRVCVV